MRTLTSTLTDRQKANSYIAVLKATLTHGATTYIYDLTQIKDLDHTEQPYQQKAEIVLNNSDGALTALDLKGYKLVLSYGMRTSAGEETSDAAPLYVVGQNLNSQEGSLLCVLSAIGLSNILAEDRANDSYIPTSSDTKTVKTIIGEIMAATLACYNHCPAYEVVWDSEDSLIDTYIPKDSFRIYIGGSRMAAIRRLLDYTKCVGRFQTDGKYHIMSPTTTGTTYDYEYTLEGGHIFFAKAYRKSLVLPNYVVVQSRDADSPQYTGYYTDADSIASFREVRNYIQTSLTSNAQATAIATAVISKYQMQANMGSADVPMNCGAEIFDYVKVTDSREGDNRVGNLGSIRRYWRKGAFRMTFSFGGWLSVTGLLSDLEVNSDVGSSLARTTSKGQDIYLDDITDGDTFKKVLATQISAGKINLTSECTYAVGYDPSGKRRVFTATPTTPYDVGDLWLAATVGKRCTTARATGAYVAGDWTAITIDDITDGTTYQRVKSTAINASGMVILDQTIAGTYGLVLASQISAGEIVLSSTGMQIDKNGVVTAASGTRVELKSTGLRGYNGATLEFELSASDGRAYFGAGTCILSATGAQIKGQAFVFSNAAATVHNWIYGAAGGLAILATGDIIPMSNIVPNEASMYNFGSNTYYWATLYSTILSLKETTTPSANAGSGKVYTKSDNKLYFQDGDGVEHTVAFV